MAQTIHIHEYNDINEMLEHLEGESVEADVRELLVKLYPGDDGDIEPMLAEKDPKFTISVDDGDERCDYYSEDRYTVNLPDRDAADELADILGGKVIFDGANRGSKRYRVTYRNEVYVYADSEEKAKFAFENMPKEELNSKAAYVEMVSLEEY